MDRCATCRWWATTDGRQGQCTLLSTAIKVAPTKAGIRTFDRPDALTTVFVTAHDFGCTEHDPIEQDA